MKKYTVYIKKMMYVCNASTYCCVFFCTQSWLTAPIVAAKVDFNNVINWLKDPSLHFCGIKCRVVTVKRDSYLNYSVTES